MHNKKQKLMMANNIKPEPIPRYIKFELDPSNPTGTNTISARANTVMGTTTGISSNRTFQYSRNGENWLIWDGSALTISQNNPVYMRSNITADGSSLIYSNLFFGNNTKITCSGDMRYMAMTNNYIDTRDIIPLTYRYCYCYMFSGCTSLTTAPTLPATVLTDYCYNGMFSGCTSLTVTPQLPTLDLVIGCYGDMFSGCTSLTVASQLPAIFLNDHCCNSMFKGCTSLQRVAIRADGILPFPTNAFSDMLSNTGTTSQPPNTVYCDITTILKDTNATNRWVRDDYLNRPQ